MPRVTFKVTGLRELERALSTLKKATAKAVAQRALLKAAQPMADDARQRAPDDPATGGFDLHTTVRTGKKTTRGARHRKESEVEVFFGPRSRHAQLQEFGTSKMAAQPYMRPAWDAGKMQALETIKDEMWNEIAKAAKRAAKRR